MKHKASSYYHNKREDILGLFREPPKRVLELGCGAGDFGNGLKQKFGSYIVGIDILPQAIEEASYKIDKGICANLDTFKWNVLEKDFDLVIANDVLEHLQDPWYVVEQCYKCLCHGGWMIASLPNVRHFTIFKELIQGNWTYADAGILDNTHLRFFTKKSMIKLFENNHFKVCDIVSLTEVRSEQLSLYERMQDKIFYIYHIYPDLFTEQYAVVAQKP